MLLTAECVSPSHPDKVCDRISDAILDAALEQDPKSRVAIETMGGHGIVTVTGEMTTNAFVDIPAIVTRIAPGMGVQVNIAKQSREIANGVDTGGAGDQGVMVGYACAENFAMIPHEMFMARELCQYLYKRYPFDGKTQVTMDQDGCLVSVLASWQDVPKEELKQNVLNWLFESKNLKPNNHLPEIICNPAGDWSLGGFAADTGVTGRKIVVDAYGPRIPVGGGAFSGKDSTKVDRSAAYMARHLAVKIVSDLPGLDEALVKVAYGIGMNKPLMLNVLAKKDGLVVFCGEMKKGDTITTEFGGSKGIFTLTDEFDFSPSEIIKKLQLEKPQFEKLAEWGSFGHGSIWDM